MPDVYKACLFKIHSPPLQETKSGDDIALLWLKYDQNKDPT